MPGYLRKPTNQRQSAKSDPSLNSNNDKSYSGTAVKRAKPNPPDEEKEAEKEDKEEEEEDQEEGEEDEDEDEEDTDEEEDTEEEEEKEKPVRPTVHWRESWGREQAKVAAYTGGPSFDIASMLRRTFIDVMDGVFDKFEAELDVAMTADEGFEIFPIYAAVKRFALDARCVSSYIETGERAPIGAYIEAFIEFKGVDVGKMGEELGFRPGCITDQWRDW